MDKEYRVKKIGNKYYPQFKIPKELVLIKHWCYYYTETYRASTSGTAINYEKRCYMTLEHAFEFLDAQQDIIIYPYRSDRDA